MTQRLETPREGQRYTLGGPEGFRWGWLKKDSEKLEG